VPFSIPSLASNSRDYKYLVNAHLRLSTVEKNVSLMREIMAGSSGDQRKAW
jgi:hypothetical protein